MARSRGLGDVYKRQALHVALRKTGHTSLGSTQSRRNGSRITEISMAV
jgi:hypothetical protein